MKVQNPNLPALGAGATSRPEQTARLGGRPQGSPDAGAASGDDVHLSELVRSLRSLASDSPERQAHLEKLARAVASGTYKVDADAVAGRIIDDAIAY